MHTQPTSTPFLSSISRNLSSVTHTSASEPASPLPSCPSPQSHDSPVADFILWTLGNGRTTVPTTPQSRSTLPIPTRPTFAPRQITAHLPKSQKSQSSPDNTPSPRAQHRRQRNHSPSPQIPKITVQSRQHSLPTRPTNRPSPKEITAHPPKSQQITVTVQTLRISRFLTNTSISGTIFNGITVSSLALTLTRIVTSLVGPSAAQTSAASQVARVHLRPLPRLPANPTSQPYIPGFPPGLAKALSP